MEKSICCKADRIYLGRGNSLIFSVMLGPLYHYCCSNCGGIEWSTEKEKTKYKWYNFDRDKLKKLLKIKEDINND